MKSKGVALVIILLIWCLSLAKAQPYTASVKHYGPENGLSHREVNAIFQDKQGFMWFGTKFGLNRFDGQKFTTYTKERNGLDFDDVQSIAQDAEGYLWLMGPFGQSRITLLNPLTGKAISFEEKFKKQAPSGLLTVPQRLLSSVNGTVFFTNSQPAILISYHPPSGLRYVPLPQFKSLAVFAATTRNTVWAVADDKHVLELTPDGRIVHQFSHAEAPVSICFGQRNAGIEFFYFAPDPAKRTPNLFYSIDESGNRREWPYSLLKSLNQYIYPVAYAFNRSGLLWDGIRLQHLTKGVVLTIAGQTGGESITNRSFYCDRNGLFWLGTSFGVYQVKLSENHFHRLFYQESNKGDSVVAIRGITVLGDTVFANLEKLGLYSSPKLGGTPKKMYPPAGSYAKEAGYARAYGLTQDGQGTLYGGIGDRLVRYKQSTATATTTELPVSFGSWAIHPFGYGQWVLGGESGLLLFDAHKEQLKSFTQYNQFTELAQAHILHIAPDRQGMLWICANTGLYTIDPRKGITARYWIGGAGRFYLPAESFQHFYQDPQGVYWLATANAGLIRWDRRQNLYRQFRRSEGLSNDNLYAVYADKQNFLWMSSDFGIMQFDPVRLTTRAYFVEDGITHNEFNRIAHYQEENGRIYFGGLNGITVFDPQDFQTQQSAPGLHVRITSFRQYDNATDQLIDKTEEVVTTRTIAIEPDDRSSVLDFALLNYINAEKNVYAYQLKGIDKEWTYQAEPTLRMNNLPYGDYRLLIKAQAANGQWSANTLDIRLVVVRPMYMRTWFLIGMVLLVGAAVWAWLRWRIWHHQAEQLRLETQVRQATARIEQQAQDLLRLNQTRSHFFANISHEFRTPLTVILGMAAQLEEYQPDKKPQQLQQVADLIKRNGSNLLRLINQLLDLSKIEAGEMHLQPVRADLVGFARYIGESFQSMAKSRNIGLHFLWEEKTCEADFDRDKLSDVLTNLLSNALKFTPAGGHVSCRLKRYDSWQALSGQGYHEELTPTSHLDNPWIRISVGDTGPGIEPGSLPRVFDRFFQADHPSATQTGGTGIGLALVRELVLLMHGGLAVRNLQGQGAEFVVSLPHTWQAPLAQEPLSARVQVSPRVGQWVEDAQELSGHEPTLLLVEDNDDVATYIHNCLGTYYLVTRAENGQAGIELALEKMPDMIVSDVMMPLKDGLELCNTLKNDARTSHIPIVLLTAKAALSDRLAGLRRGADAYLVKPFQREELLAVVANLLQTRRMLQGYYSQLALGIAPAQPPPAAVAGSLEDEFVIKLRTTVEAHLTNTELSVDTLCQQMGMSRTSLHLKITALTGMSISHYVRSLRLRKAQELLTASGLNVSEVAYAVGFDNPKYFSRVFAEEFGVSPQNYRLSARG